MNKLSELYDVAQNNDVAVLCLDTEHIKSMSMPSKFSDNCYIAINPLMLDTVADETVWLAHELGHCMTGSFYNKYSPFDIRGKHERRADKWAIKKLIPEDELKEACKHCINRYELSEHFGVTEDFMQKALDYYTQ